MSETLYISVDGMGGDNSPEVVIEGIAHFIRHESAGQNTRFIIHGNKPRLETLISKEAGLAEKCMIEHTELAVSMDAKISHALRRGKDSSMWNTIASVKNKSAHVGISAGNTGALMAMSKLQLRMMPGVQRPAIAALWPRINGMSVVLDVGANVSSDAAQLVEFAILGDAYYRAIFGPTTPNIGLLNNGTEDQKGHDVIRAAHERLRETELGIIYGGYAEGNDIANGDFDVIVTDGFTGNVALKTAEGTAKLVKTFLEEAYSRNMFSKLAALVSLPVLKYLKKRIDPRGANGGVFLGLNGIIIKSHGGTDAVGYANALKIAATLAKSNFNDEIAKTLNALHDEDEKIGFIV